MTPPAVMVRAGAWAYEVMTPSFGVSLVLMMVAPCVSRVAVRSSISIGPFPCVHGSSLRGRWYYNEVTQRITRLWRGVKGYEEHRRDVSGSDTRWCAGTGRSSHDQAACRAGTFRHPG